MRLTNLLTDSTAEFADRIAKRLGSRRHAAFTELADVFADTDPRLGNVFQSMQCIEADVLAKTFAIHGRLDVAKTVIFGHGLEDPADGAHWHIRWLDDQHLDEHAADEAATVYARRLIGDIDAQPADVETKLQRLEALLDGAAAGPIGVAEETADEIRCLRLELGQDPDPDPVTQEIARRVIDGVEYTIDVTVWADGQRTYDVFQASNQMSLTFDGPFYTPPTDAAITKLATGQAISGTALELRDRLLRMLGQHMDGWMVGFLVAQSTVAKALVEGALPESVIAEYTEDDEGLPELAQTLTERFLAERHEDGSSVEDFTAEHIDNAVRTLQAIPRGQANAPGAPWYFDETEDLDAHGLTIEQVRGVMSTQHSTVTAAAQLLLDAFASVR